MSTIASELVQHLSGHVELRQHVSKLPFLSHSPALEIIQLHLHQIGNTVVNLILTVSQALWSQPLLPKGTFDSEVSMRFVLAFDAFASTSADRGFHDDDCRLLLLRLCLLHN